MTSDNFCYWLQGFFEMTDAKELTPEQIDMIKDHLGYVFDHRAGKTPTVKPMTQKQIVDQLTSPFLDTKWQPPTTVTC